ncbi:MAG: hypothetical protein M0027_12400 [Candidatus Dormibacteraeota bacterium]|nr:hypothetical protein [Candidatus Dormibacteraeota bacterium]
MGRLLHLSRLYLAVLAGALFLLALALSWTLGADHLWIQGVAMILALGAFGVAALAAARS